MDSFFFYAFAAGALLSLSTAPLGCFVIWRKMAYFGDALAHSALLGVVLGLLWQIPLIIAILPISISIAIIIALTNQHSRFSSDTLLGITAHGGLALGVVIMAMIPQLQVDLMAYLFGDILAVNQTDLLFIALLSISVITTLILNWKSLILITLNEDVALVSGVNVKQKRLLLMILMALTVAISIKLVGLLLITSMLILPAAIARFYVNNPPQMAIISTFSAICMVAFGLLSSYYMDTPSGPSIVLIGAILFSFSAAYRAVFTK